MKKKFTFEIEQVYQNEADKIIKSRETGKVFHNSGNITASGDEVEKTVRDFFKRRLPAKYYVGHGHIVDKQLEVSPQTDIIVADNSATPILLEGDKNIQYFPYESIYCIGEIKSTYYKSADYITSFSNNIKKIKEELTRELTPNNYIGNGISLGENLKIDCNEEYRNPLFSFMIFANSGDLEVTDIATIFSKLPDSYLPNIICFLDGRIIVKASIIEEENSYKVGSIEMNCHKILNKDDIYWFSLNFENNKFKNGQSLAILMLGIFQHLKSCILLDPPIYEYLNHILLATPHKPDNLDIRLTNKLIIEANPILRKFFDELATKKDNLNNEAINKKT